MNKYLREYSALAEAILRDHEKVGADFGGHDFEHALMVANYGAQIANGANTKKLVWLAGITHNTDRLIMKGLVRHKEHRTIDELTKSKVSSYLKNLKLKESEMEAITEAVREHHKLNSPYDNAVTIALKDADRLANVGALMCLRSAKHFQNLHVVDYVHLFKHPFATYRAPDSITKDIWYALEWEKWLRLPKAKKIGKKRFKFLQVFLKDLEEQLREGGVYPYPFPKLKK